MLPQQQPEEAAVDCRERKPILEESEQKVPLAEHQMRHHPERLMLVVAPEHEIAYDKVDALSITDARKVESDSVEAALQRLDALWGLEEGFFGEGAVEILADLRKAAVLERRCALILLFFIEIEPTTKD